MRYTTNDTIRPRLLRRQQAGHFRLIANVPVVIRGCEELVPQRIERLVVVAPVSVQTQHHPVPLLRVRAQMHLRSLFAHFVVPRMRDRQELPMRQSPGNVGPAAQQARDVGNRHSQRNSPVLLPARKHPRAVVSYSCLIQH